MKLETVPSLIVDTDAWQVLNHVFGGVSNTLTPQQYLELFQSNKISIPEVRLWLAVLESVYIDWLEHKNTPSDITKRTVAEIETWIYGDGIVMELIGEAINSLIQIPYSGFKSKLHAWLKCNRPKPEALPELNIDIGTLFDEVPKPNIDDIGGDFDVSFLE